MLSRFVLCVYYPPSRGDRAAVVLALLGFAAISLVPIALELTPQFQRDNNNGRAEFTTLFLALHWIFINLPVTLGILIALLFQDHEIRSSPCPESLSVTGLAVQAVVFTFVGVSWIWRMYLNGETLRQSPWGVFVKWYVTVGWAAVDNLLFAFVQAVALWLARQHWGQDAQAVVNNDETTPLLSE